MNELTALMTLGGMTIVAAVVIILRGIDTVRRSIEQKNEELRQAREEIAALKDGQRKSLPYHVRENSEDVLAVALSILQDQEIVEARRRQQIGRIQELVGDMRAGQYKDRPSGRRPQL